MASWKNPALIGLISMGMIQLKLCDAAFLDYMLHSPRTSFWSHNREGLVSLGGFVVILLIGIEVAQFLKREKDVSKRVWSLLRAAMILGVASGLLHVLVQQSSRRLANASYICCVGSLNCFLLAALICADFFTGTKQSILLDAVSRNQLVVFLAANVSTGIINYFLVDTLTCSSMQALAIVAGYALLVSLLGLGLSRFQTARRPKKL
jgi:predicted acyltransferase